MTIVKELNELAEKMTGTNPRATTDKQALDYIEQNYTQGGGSGGAGVVDITLDSGFFQRYLADDTKYGQLIVVENEQDIEDIQQIIDTYNNSNSIIRVKLLVYGIMETLIYPNFIKTDDDTAFLATMITQNGQIYVIMVAPTDEGSRFMLMPNMFQLGLR